MSFTVILHRNRKFDLIHVHYSFRFLRRIISRYLYVIYSKPNFCIQFFSFSFLMCNTPKYSQYFHSHPPSSPPFSASVETFPMIPVSNDSDIYRVYSFTPHCCATLDLLL